MPHVVKFDACGTAGQKTGEIFIVADHVVTIVPHPGSTGQASTCYISVVGGTTYQGTTNPIMVLGSASDAINKLGFTIK